MTPIAILILSLSMSTDAFAAAVGRGAAHRPSLPVALKWGLVFGVVEAITPLIGYGLGSIAANYVQAVDHWIAFILLAVLGGRMIRAGLATDEPASASRQERHGFWNLATTGLATSIDAMAVGVGLAFIDVNILLVAGVIGACTLVMVTAGIMLGRALGAIVGKRAEIVGGLILIGVGTAILYEHLSRGGGALLA